jgi:cadmium resistance protein CadD (predicted permease)
MAKVKLVYALVLGLSGCLIAGCSSNPTAPTTDSITLTSIVPAAGTTLSVGDRVTFTAVVNCTIVSSEGGLAAMVIQDQATRAVRDEADVQAQTVLRKGTETVTLSQTVTIPANLGGSTITVSLPIFLTGSTSTAAVVTRNYAIR